MIQLAHNKGKINNNINKNTSALQLVEARSTIETNKDLINEKTYNDGSRRLKKTKDKGSGIKKHTKTQQNVIRSEQKNM